jgi:hypothetical protein
MYNDRANAVIYTGSTQINKFLSKNYKLTSPDKDKPGKYRIPNSTMWSAIKKAVELLEFERKYDIEY